MTEEFRQRLDAIAAQRAEDDQERAELRDLAIEAIAKTIDGLAVCVASLTLALEAIQLSSPRPGDV